jgi:hypothetical protein
VEFDKTQQKTDTVHTMKIRAGKRRTYFFDIRKTKGDDFYITLTENTKRLDNSGFERHKIFIYKEDFNRFLSTLTDLIDKVKSEYMPEYDYDEFAKKQEEWESAQINDLTLQTDNGEL